MIVIILKLGANSVIHWNVFTRLVSHYTFILWQRLCLQISFSFVWFWVYVFNRMFYMTAFHIYGSLEIIKN